MAADDLILTLSDADEISDESSGEDSTPPPRSETKGTKRKRETKQQSSVKKQKSEEDEDLFSDFEFEAGLDNVALEDLTGWALNGKPQLETGKKDVDIDEIVARRRPLQAATETTLEDDSDEDVDGVEDGSDDEQVPSDELNGDVSGASDIDTGRDSDDAGVDDEQGDDDEDEAAVPVAHPDDQISDSDSEDEEDAIEAEKRNAFFANDPDTKQATSLSEAFHSMNLSRPILKGLASVGFSKPTPIQAKTIPIALEGQDLVGGAVTGSGKTAAFLIPILERLLFRPKRTPTTRVVILMPTRELALQCFNVATKLASFTDITFGQAIGGLNSREQEKQLKLRPDIVVATPGRFIDLERNSSSFAVNTIEILVLDEADRMLEEGFADELNEILTKIPKSRQTMLFSATMTSKVDDLIRVGLQRPVRLMVDAQRQTVSGLTQEFVRLRPGKESKRLAYLLHLCARVHTSRAIIFFRQKKDAHRVRIIFALAGWRAAELHGSMSQEQRLQSVEAFRTGAAAFLLATDLASRGLDIKGIDTVINYEAPQTHEIYLHRVGRTARAGRSGVACTLAAEPDRKVVKAAVKTGRAQGARIAQRAVDAADAEAWFTRLVKWEGEVEEVLREEKEARALAQLDREITRADNIVKFEGEIKARPRKTWFESEKDKRAAKERGGNALNGVSEAEARAKRERRKMSNKEKKKLQDKDDRKAGMEWKKGKADRLGGGGARNGAGKGKRPKAKAGGKPGRK